MLKVYYRPPCLNHRWMSGGVGGLPLNCLALLDYSIIPTVTGMGYYTAVFTLS